MPKKQSKNVLLIKAAQKRIQRLKKADLHPKELGILQANISIFYSNIGKQLPQNTTGINLKGLSTKDISRLARIVRPFMKSDKTTPGGIKKLYKAELEKIRSKLGDDIIRQIKKGMKEDVKGSTTQKMLYFIENTEHVKASAISRGLIYSEQLKQIWDTQKDGDISYDQANSLVNKIYDMTVKGKFDDIDSDKIRRIVQKEIDKAITKNKEDIWKDMGDY